MECKMDKKSPSRSPQTRLIHEGYRPEDHSRAVKPPLYHTSTFLFESAEEGAAWFRINNGVAQPGDPEKAGHMYSRFSTPTIDLLETRLAILDGGEAALAFGTGMAAISTTLLALCDAGDVILHSTPLYGGSESFIRNSLQRHGIRQFEFPTQASEAEAMAEAERASARGRVAVIYVESPTNPTNEIVDLAMCARLADALAERQGLRPIVVCDNTLLGPIGQQPLKHGVDIALYSLTKYVGGHSDLLAGAVVGPRKYLDRIYSYRNLLGTVVDAHTAWLLTRSLETVGLRMRAASDNARTVADYLRDHPKVGRIFYPGHFQAGSRASALHKQQSVLDGSTLSFEVGDNRETAFRFLDGLTLIRLAVSLGGTESLILHPLSTSHSNVPAEVRERLGYTESLVRLSVGLEAPEDLIADLDQALANV